MSCGWRFSSLARVFLTGPCSVCEPGFYHGLMHVSMSSWRNGITVLLLRDLV